MDNEFPNQDLDKHHEQHFAAFRSKLKAAFLELRLSLNIQISLRGPMKTEVEGPTNAKNQVDIAEINKEYMKKVKEMIDAARNMVEMVEAGLREKYEELLEDYDCEYVELITRMVEWQAEDTSTAGALGRLSLGDQMVDGDEATSISRASRENSVISKKRKLDDMYGEVTELKVGRTESKTGVLKFNFSLVDPATSATEAGDLNMGGI
jgi:hypothetical protein